MSVPEDRRSRFQVNLTAMRLTLANRRGDLSVVVEEAQRLLASETTADAGMPGRCDELRAAALVSLGTAEMWTLRTADAERHLEEGADLAHRIGRPWLEISALSQRAWIMSFRSFKLAAERFLRAIELAREHGWSAATIRQLPMRDSVPSGHGRCGLKRPRRCSSKPTAEFGATWSPRPEWCFTKLGAWWS